MKFQCSFDLCLMIRNGIHHLQLFSTIYSMHLLIELRVLSSSLYILDVRPLLSVMGNDFLHSVACLCQFFAVQNLFWFHATPFVGAC